MEKLFEALREKYDGAEVRDVKFMVNASEANDQSVGDLDSQLAEVVRRGVAISEPSAL